MHIHIGDPTRPIALIDWKKAGPWKKPLLFWWCKQAIHMWTKKHESLNRIWFPCITRKHTVQRWPKT